MTALQVKAFFIVCLLAGHEAARVQQQLGMEKLDTPEEDEKDFQTKNNQCSWSTMSWKCYSSNASAPEGMCAWRSLPWDWSSSESCRLTDGYMASPDNRAKFFAMQAGVLSAKSKKFADKCAGSSLFYLNVNRKCARRMKHMMRAMKFMSKAQDSNLVKSLSTEEKAHEKKLFQDSLKNMADAIGDDGAYVLMLQQKMQVNKVGLKKDAKGTVSNAIRILSMLLKGTPEEKQTARQEILHMPDEHDTLSTEEEAQLDESAAKLAESLRTEENGTMALIDNVDVVVPDNDTDTESSLLQTNGLVARSDDFITGAAFVIVVLLVVMTVVWVVTEILIGIIAWAFIALLGCGMYAAGYNSYSVSNTAGYAGTMGFYGTAKCFAKAFAYPFILTGRAVVGMYRWFWGIEPPTTTPPGIVGSMKNYATNAATGGLFSLAELPVAGLLPPPTFSGPSLEDEGFVDAISVE